MKKPTLREMFTIPNILSYFRILLIPLFVYLYFKAETPPEFFRAAVVLGISGFTDLFDGKIARPDDTVSLGRCACSAVCT